MEALGLFFIALSSVSFCVTIGFATAPNPNNRTAAVFGAGTLLFAALAFLSFYLKGN